MAVPVNAVTLLGVVKQTPYHRLRNIHFATEVPIGGWPLERVAKIRTRFPDSARYATASPESGFRVLPVGLVSDIY